MQFCVQSTYYIIKRLPLKETQSYFRFWRRHIYRQADLSPILVHFVVFVNTHSSFFRSFFLLCSPSPIQLIFHSLLQHVNLENIKWNRNKIILRRPLAYTPCDEAVIPTSGRFAIHGGSHTSFWTHVSFDSVYMLICLCRRINTSGSSKDPTKRVSVSTR